MEILVQVPFCCSLLGGGPIVLSYLKWSEVIRKSIFCTYCDITGETTELLSTYRNKLLKQPIIYSAAPAAFKPRFFTKVVNRKSVRATLLYATRINLLPLTFCLPLSYQSNKLINPVLLEITISFYVCGFYIWPFL